MLRREAVPIQKTNEWLNVSARYWASRGSILGSIEATSGERVAIGG